MSDGLALRAATTLGCDLGIIGVDSSIDDVLLTRGFTGLPDSLLAPSARRPGIDAPTLDESILVKEARRRYRGGAEAAPSQGWTDIWSAGTRCPVCAPCRPSPSS